MAETKKGVVYTFSGEYYSGAKETTEQIKPYELSVTYPEETPIALSLFKTSLTRTKDTIYRMMLKKYPDFKAVRTHVITDVKHLGNGGKQPKSIACMNTKQLANYIAENKLEIDVEVYGDDLAKLREIIALAEKDAEAFKKAYAADVEAYEFNKSIKDLNDIDDNSGSGEDSAKDSEGSEDDQIDEILG